MPYVLKHQDTSRIYTCTLVNNYKLSYYGTKYWDFEDDAEAERHPFLQSQDVADPAVWHLLELSENQLKLCNVKLKNDPRLALYWDEAKQSMTVSVSP
jgi:translation initiation factor 2 alpha subunit (eIF-2alpha)